MRHSDKKHSIRLLTALLSALPLSVGAAGLGKLTVQSAIGQPLRAEVELAANADELSSMSAKLASPSAFKQAGVEFASSLAGVRIAVDKRGSRPVLVVTSDRVVNEPYLDMLIELNWASGRLVREYTFLLDPADMPRPAPVEPVAVPGSSTSRAVAAAPAAAPTRTPAADGTYEVRRGDTLRRIATEKAPSGVSLDQMLVALVRANPDAFDGGNMNRLRAGRILSIPDQSAAEAVSPQEARSIVAAQTADFAAYRARLAGSVATPSSAADAGGRSSGGKIEARVEDKAPAAAAASDQVRVSKSAADTGKISALEEEVIAKDRALKDANSRLADLERNVRELQKMVELKSTPMAEAQQKAATPPAAAPAPAPASAPAPNAEEKPVPDLIAGADSKKPEAPAEKAEDKPVPDLIALADEKSAAEAPKAEPAPTPAPAAEAPKEAPAAPPAATDEEPEAAIEEPGLLSDPGTLAGLGGILVLLLGYLGYRKYKAKAPAPDVSPPSTTAGMEAVPASTSIIGATGGGQSVDTSASSIQTDFSQSSLSSIDADEGVDPVAEADVYMAYGRDAQAEEILLEALKTEPSRHAIHLKLLEIYAQRKSVKQFETLATELYAQTGGKGADWEKAAQMGRAVDPTNPLYGGSAEAEPDSDAQAAMAATVVVAGADKMRDTWTLPGDIGQLVSGDAPDDNLATVALDAPPVLTDVDVDVPASPADAGLDFDLDVPPAEPAPQSPTVGVATTLTKPGEESEGESSLDFDLGLDFTADKPEGEDVSTLVLEKNVADTAETLAQQDAPAFDLDLSLPSEPTAEESEDAAAVVDLERTDIGNLIDFNFDAADAPVPAQAAEPMIDLSDINLDLGADSSTLATDVVGDVGKALAEAAPPADELPPSAVSTVINPEDMLGGEEPPQTAAEEAETKLELARAYEEMGDKEGARELLQEVVREGTAEQQAQANDMLGRLA